MNVATDRDRALHRLHSALLEHQLLHVLAKMLEVILRQQLALAVAVLPQGVRIRFYLSPVLARLSLYQYLLWVSSASQFNKAILRFLIVR